MWIDFKELRSQLDFEKVLREFGVTIKRKGDQHQGFCPLPSHHGKKNSPSFSAHLGKGIFQCFGCGAKGNVLEFAAMMQNVNPQDGKALREVALDLQRRFCPRRQNRPAETAKLEKKPSTDKPTNVAPVIVNPPLDFELKDLDQNHPYLIGRGFSKETVSYFGLGYCSRGLLKSRLAIPLHNHKGQLIGYAGRVVDDSAINEDNPKYRFPSKRERDGKVLEFRKTHFLYNGFRIKAPVSDLAVVEGFASVWWLHQNGVTDVVGTMGSDCSERQSEIIVSLVAPAGRVWLIPDGDEAGERFAKSFLTQISPFRFTRWVRLAPGRQPTDLQTSELQQEGLQFPVQAV